MFSVVYEFIVVPGQEENFKKLWHAITCDIKAHDGGLGSRLHREVGRENTWIAYAQWPSRAMWLRTSPVAASVERSSMTKALRETACVSIKTLLELDVVDDLLEPNCE